MNVPSEHAEYELLTYPGATLDITCVRTQGSFPEIRLSGNRRGILSLANVLLWLLARSFERELLTITQLPFARPQGSVSLVVRVTDDEATPEQAGLVTALDGASQFEWALPESDLRQVALSLHRLASFWEHEYDLYPHSDDHVRDARIQARLTDVSRYMQGSRET